VREIEHSHLNYVVLDTKQWEQTAAFYLDQHPNVMALTKNAGLGFAIPYMQQRTDARLHAGFLDPPAI